MSNRSELSELCAVDPISVEHATKLRQEILQEVEKIQSQLSDPNREYEDGSRMSGRDYFEWRKRAATAQRFARQRAGFLRDWIRSSNAENNHAAWQLKVRQVEALERIVELLEKHLVQ